MDNNHQIAYTAQLGQLTKAELKNLLCKTNKASASSRFISRTQAQKECIRRATAYMQISQYSGSAIIACLVFVVLVKLLE